MGETRARCHKIRSLEVQGGFLDGVRIEFSDRMTCIIGGRGAGKTTVLQFLRFALVDPRDPVEGRERKELQAFVKKVLGPHGVILVQIETRDGVTYFVERRLGSVDVLDARKQLTGLSLTNNVVFDLDVFGPSEIEGTARTARDQLQLIDRFEPLRIRTVEEQIAGVLSDLRSNASELQLLSARRDELDATLTELPGLEATLEAQQRSDEADRRAALASELGLKALRERELKALDHVASAVGAAAAAAADAARRAADLPTFGPDARDGPNRDVLRAAQAAVTRFQDELLRLQARAQEIAGETARELNRLRAALEEVHLAQEDRYRVVIASHEEERSRADERLRLERRATELREKRRLLAEGQRALDVRQRRRRELLSQVAALREERFRLRKSIADRLTAELDSLIRVRIDRAADTSAYQRLLADALAESGRAASAAEALAGVVPADLLLFVATKEVGELVKQTKLTAKRAEAILEHLRSKLPALHELEVVDLPDVARIELDVAGTLKTADELSTGQRCTTILPLLLLESERPLLIDQPEDNLDNKFLAEYVVPRIGKAKRQIIFVTHNPNIPVLGDAERVVVLDAPSGTQARVVDAGDVDEVKSHVEAILEGGREAFEARRRRYLDRRGGAGPEPGDRGHRGRPPLE